MFKAEMNSMTSTPPCCGDKPENFEPLVGNTLIASFFAAKFTSVGNAENFFGGSECSFTK